MKFIGPMAHTGQLLREVGSWAFGEKRRQWLYGPSEPNGDDHPVEEYTLIPSGLPMEAVEWLRWRGYRACMAVAPGRPSGGLLFGRKNEPAMIAVVGDVLVWDGHHVRVKED